MPDLLIRNVDPALKRSIERRARAQGRSISEEAKLLIRRALSTPDDNRKLGSEMFDMIRPEDRGDDLVFEYKGEFPKPPDLG